MSTTTDYFEMLEAARSMAFDFTLPDAALVERAARFGVTYDLADVTAARLDAEARHATASSHTIATAVLRSDGTLI